MQTWIALSSENKFKLRRPEFVLAQELWRIFCADRTHSRKEVAARMGKSPDCLDLWINEKRDVPASEIANLYRAVDRDIRIFTALTRYTDLAIHRLPTGPFRTARQLLDSLIFHSGEIYKLWIKLLLGEKFTREDLAKLEEEIADQKASLDEALALARKKVSEQEGEGK